MSRPQLPSRENSKRAQIRSGHRRRGRHRYNVAWRCSGGVPTVACFSPLVRRDALQTVSHLSTRRASVAAPEKAECFASLRLSNRPAPWTALLAVIAVSLVLWPAGTVFARTPPQEVLPTVTLRIGAATVKAEVADERDERTIGLMGRTELAEGTGMLFVFREPQALGFWMQDTLIPLSIAYVNAAGVIREIHDLKPLDETSARSTFRDLVYALEVPQGWFTRQKILPGDKILGLPSPSIAQPE